MTEYNVNVSSQCQRQEKRLENQLGESQDSLNNMAAPHTTTAAAVAVNSNHESTSSSATTASTGAVHDVSTPEWKDTAIPKDSTPQDRRQDDKDDAIQQDGSPAMRRMSPLQQNRVEQQNTIASVNHFNSEVVFSPPPVVGRNFGTSKDDDVSDYSDASLNDDAKDSMLQEDLEGERDEDDDDEEDDDDDDEYEEDAEDDDDEQPNKLFIGQVPKHMEEPDLFAIFEKFGPMEDVAIIRDKHTGQHRGCAFVTFLQKESAEQCEKELHGTFAFEGGKRPVQVRPAGWKEGELLNYYST
jgi:hypothetical protein